MAKRVNVDHYGDLFYDMANEFDEIVITTVGEIFEGDEAAADPSMVSDKKMLAIKKQVAGAIFKTWLKHQKLPS